MKYFMEPNLLHPLLYSEFNLILFIIINKGPLTDLDKFFKAWPAARPRFVYYTYTYAIYCNKDVQSCLTSVFSIVRR